MNFFRSDIYENLVMALDTLRGNKLRSFLTVVGVIIGVVTVMAISSIISGIDLAVRKEVKLVTVTYLIEKAKEAILVIILCKYNCIATKL